MRKSLVICMLSAILVCAVSLPTLFAADAPADGLAMEKTKNHVTFNHSSHSSAACAECHHKAGDDASAIKGCSSEGCHDVFDKKDKSEKSYYKAMHDKKASISTCVSCHTDTAGGDKAKKKELAGCKKSVCHP